MFKRILDLRVRRRVSYAVFFATFLYALCFVGNFIVPTTIDGRAAQVSFRTALLIDLGLLGAFALQHSVMARPFFKRWLTRFIPEAAERSTYVLFSSVALIALFYFWQPLGGVIWYVDKHRRAGAAVRRVLHRLDAGAGVHVPDQPLRPVRPAPGVAAAGRQAVHASEVRHAGPVQAGASSAVPGLALRLLGDADHDGDTPAVRDR